MVPLAPTTGPGVMLPPSDRVHSTCPVVGPATAAVAEWVASCNASGHGDAPAGATTAVAAAAGPAPKPSAAMSTSDPISARRALVSGTPRSMRTASQILGG